LRKENTGNNHPLQKYYAKIYRRYDLVNSLFTLGMDRKWRRTTVQECMEGKPAKVLDLCCGTGDLAIELRRKCGENVSVTGYDLSHEMLHLATQKSLKKDFPDISFLQGDVSEMPFPDAEFDAISIGFGFRNLTFENANSDRHLGEIARVLKKRGKLCIIESAVPSGKLIRFFYKLYLRLILIPLGGVISGDWKAYRYLALSSANFYSETEVQDLLKQYDMHVRQVKRFFLGAVNLTVAEKS